ncbi:molybdopterin-containing oxidoreductase family protein [Faecalicatena contorta]|uniref:molybdopterin-containing oxidoreductase family protein n=3 Tax=Lachnospiraceae TaxID=186803 RepID=UPI001F3B79AB|nr:molybdopterin-dependent oxidoreductase [Faecalicatena contorta]MCF2668730.1 molybdopterin-dependent oxidoreductase [Faecalicatena contorta]
MSEMKVVKTSCSTCGSCCEVDTYVEDGKLVSVEGARNTPMQSGGMCAKGAAAKQYVYNKDRILYPMKRVGKKGEGKFERISWEEAYEMIAENLLRIRKESGPESVVFYAGYPKWYRPALLRLANAFGSPNYCTESSTCFQAAALAWRSLYGNGICGPDMKNAKTLLVWSSNLYHSNTPMSGTYQGLKKRGAKIIVVDPRHSVTAHDADIHLQLIPGTDGALALSMAQVIIEEGLYDKEFVENYVYGFEEYREYVQNFVPEEAEKITGVPAAQVRLAARTYAGNGPASVMFSASPIVHHINGVQNYRAVFSLIAITGNYDVEGGNRTQPGPSSLANEFGRVRRFDGIEAIGQKDFPVWFDLSCDEAQCTKLADYILEEKPYPIKAVFAMGLNHRMWPQPEHLQRALEKLDFYVNVELFMSESSNAADLVLPACTSYEREEVHVGKGGRFYLSNRAIEPVGEAKNDIEIIIDLLKKMGLKDEALENGYEAYMQHILEPSGLTLEELKNHPQGMQGKNLFPPVVKTYESAPLHTPSGKVELKSLVLERYRESHGYEGLPVYHDYRAETKIDRNQYPLILSTGNRKPQFFHARVYRMAWLSNIEKATLVEIHPEDGEKYHIKDGATVKVVSPSGEMVGIAAYTIAGKPGVVNIYHGNPKGDANELIGKDYLDPISGFPGYRSYFCRIERVEEES